MSKSKRTQQAKKGIIGAFCRAYTVSAAIASMLADVYLSTDQDDRYTFSRGSTALGVVVYDDSFSYSHHATDPASGQLCNAFDLVRLHKFGHLDGDTEASITSRKSYKLMCELAQGDKSVKSLLDEERQAQAVTDFADGYEAPTVRTK